MLRLLRVIETDYLVIGSGLAGLYFALARVRARPGRGRDQARARRREHRLRAGRRGRRAGSRRRASRPTSRTRCGSATGSATATSSSCARARRPSTSSGSPTSWASPSIATPTGSWRSGARAGTRPAASSTPRTATGWAIQEALLARRRASAADRITMLPDHMAIDLLTTAKYGGPNAVFGAYLLDQTTGDVETVVARAVVLATGGCGQGLPLHDEPGRRDRRRRRDGVPGGRARREHGVLPVPPDLPLSPGGEVVPDQRGAARRGRRSCACATAPRSCRATTR